MKPSISRSAAWLFTTRCGRRWRVLSIQSRAATLSGADALCRSTRKKELRELKVECEDFHGEWNYVIRSRME
jgi:hypothetical protein